MERCHDDNDVMILVIPFTNRWLAQTQRHSADFSGGSSCTQRSEKGTVSCCLNLAHRSGDRLIP